MSVDSAIVHEAERLLAHFTRPARELVEQNMHGPLEARLAGAVVALAQKQAVVVQHFTTETDALKALETEMTDHIRELVGLLERSIEVIAERCVGCDGLLVEAFTKISEMDAEFFDDDTSDQHPSG